LSDGDWATEELDPLSALVHDLRTPLTVAGGFADLLAKSWRDLPEDRRDEYLRRMIDATREMREMLDAAAGSRD
jgi:signal transduction histidine kinase